MKSNPESMGRRAARANEEIIPVISSFVAPCDRSEAPGKIAALYGFPRCVNAYDLSNHPPPADLWAQDLRNYVALFGPGGEVVGPVSMPYVL